jgi:hypothetical protein
VKLYELIKSISHGIATQLGCWASDPSPQLSPW